MKRPRPAFWITIGALVGISAVAIAWRPLSAAQQQPSATFIRVYQHDTPGLIAPTMVRQVHPVYTPAAMQAKAQGDISLEITVDADGSVRDATVTKSVEPSLDANAVAAVSQWTFTPGRLNDVPVAVRQTITFSLRLH